MTLATTLLALMWASVTAYALLAGADFGAGAWDLLAGTTRRGAGRRALIEHSIGPVWEANHVWLIFVLVLMWTAFPPLFASIASTLYIPLTLVALGVIARGSAFAFRKAATEVWQQRLFGAAFAFSSVVTPFFLGAIAGGVASGRVPPGLARGNVVTSWANPTSVVSGALALVAGMYLAAVYLTADARRAGEPGLAGEFRRRALVTGMAAGVLAALGIAVVHADAPRLYAGLSGRALPLVAVSGAAGVASLALLAVRRFLQVRLTAALAVATVLWAWGVAQYPHLLLPGLTVRQAAASPATLQATTISVGAGLLLLIPSLIALFALSQRGQGEQGGPDRLQPGLQGRDGRGAGAGGLVAGQLAQRGRHVVGRPVDRLGDRAGRVMQRGRDLVPGLARQHLRAGAGPGDRELVAEVHERDRTAGVVLADQGLLGGGRRLERHVPERGALVRHVGGLLHRRERQVLAGVGRLVERPGRRVREHVGAGGVRGVQVRERAEPAQRHHHRPPLERAVRAVLRAQVEHLRLAAGSQRRT
jgi:cytochrome bd ubiquinol oxidase subunit II